MHVNEKREETWHLLLCLRADMVMHFGKNLS